MVKKYNNSKKADAEQATKDTDLVTTKSPDTTVGDADLVSKSVGVNYINKFKEQSSSVENPIDEATKGNICSDEKERVEQYNAIVSREGIGQVVEITGHPETGTVRARFENPDTSFAREIITSAPTPPHIKDPDDRDEYYDGFGLMFGERDESFLPLAFHPTVLEQETSTVIESIETDEPSSALGKRKLEDSDEETNKRSKKDGDDDSGGSGSATSGSSDIGTSGPIDSAGPSNFRCFLDQTLVILISITSSILDAVNEIFILM